MTLGSTWTECSALRRALICGSTSQSASWKEPFTQTTSLSSSISHYMRDFRGPDEMLHTAVTPDCDTLRLSSEKYWQSKMTSARAGPKLPDGLYPPFNEAASCDYPA